MLALGGTTLGPDSAAEGLSNPGPPMEKDGLSGQPHPSWSPSDTPGGGGPDASDGAPSPNLPDGSGRGVGVSITASYIGISSRRRSIALRLVPRDGAGTGRVITLHGDLEWADSTGNIEYNNII